MAGSIIELVDLTKRYGSFTAVDQLNLTIAKGEIFGFLGPNGAGKSTLLRIMAGIDQDYVGEIAMSKGFTVGLLEQEPILNDSMTVIEVIREGVKPIVDLLAEADKVNAGFAEPDADFEVLISQQAKIQEERAFLFRQFCQF